MNGERCSGLSREAAKKCSPRRKPWVYVVYTPAPKGRKK
jgi:hypothetical protein